MHFLMSVLVTACAAKSAAHVRVGGAALLEKLCKESAVELGEYHHTLLTMVSPTPDPNPNPNPNPNANPKPNPNPKP